MDLGSALLEQGGAFLPGQLGVTAGVAVEEAVEGGGGGQRLFGVGGVTEQQLEQGVFAGVLRVVAVGVAGQKLVDQLGQQRLKAVADEAG